MVPLLARRDMTAAEVARFVARDYATLLEIGCHHGEDTERLLQAMPTATFFCFEADPRAIAAFKKRLGHESRVTLIPMAVAAHNGECDWYASGGQVRGREWDYSSSLHPPTGHLSRFPEIQFSAAGKVPCTTLDSWLQSLGRPLDLIDFIWADVQGAQRDLIAGGQETLARTRYLYIEVHREPLYESEVSEDELLALLPDFQPVGQYAENILLKNQRQ